MRRSFLVTTVLLSLAAPAAAQQPRIINGSLNAQPAGASLQTTFTSLVERQSDPAWIGYAVPAAKGIGTSCWGDTHEQGLTVARLEGPTSIFVLYRIEGKAVEKIRFYSDDCELDAGGLPIHWLDGIRPPESIALLSSFVTGGNRSTDRLANGALSALAAHADPSAVPALIKLARQDASPRVRGQALFWLAHKAGQQAAPEITAAIENDPDTEVKKRAVFALSQLPKDEGVPLLIQVAKSNKNPAVRKQAMFWLGQSKDPRALEFFAQVLAK